jgi:hypothetical protein
VRNRFIRRCSICHGVVFGNREDGVPFVSVLRIGDNCVSCGAQAVEEDGKAVMRPIGRAVAPGVTDMQEFQRLARRKR